MSTYSSLNTQPSSLARGGSPPAGGPPAGRRPPGRWRCGRRRRWPGRWRREDGGATDTANLIALCSRHHRLHHLGRLHITGHADDPAGMVFADERARRLTGCGRPAPPERLQPTGKWVHPTGERLDMRWLHFKEPPQPLERSLVPT